MQAASITNGVPGQPSEAEIRAELQRILSSAAFRRVQRPARFLTYLVQCSLGGESHLLKESVLGVEIFGRPASWDPRLDPVVRQEAARLRKRIAGYYETEAPDSAVRIDVPVGSYVPVFTKRFAEPAALQQLGPEPKTPTQTVPQASAVVYSRRTSRTWWSAFSLSFICVVLAAWAWWPVKAHVLKSKPEAEANELYLRGVYFWQKRTPESLTQALDLFNQAIVHDPQYALAYVGMADCYNLLREFAAMPDQEAYPRALAATQKALELDDRSAEAHASLAFISFWWNWNAALAEREYKGAIGLDPNYATAHHWYATFLSARLRHAEAMEQIAIAQKLDPSSTSILADKGLLLYLNGQKEDALALLEQLEQERNTLASTHRYLLRIHLHDGDYARAVKELQHIARDSKLEGAEALAKASAQGFASGGGKVMLERVLETQLQLYKRGLVTPYALAQSYSRLGRTADAMHFLEEAAEVRGSAFPGYRGDEAFEAIRSDPGYQRLDRAFELRLVAGNPPEGH